MAPRHVPISTYRVQVHGGFTLIEATAVVPYLQRLGVGAVYTSPYFTAAPGSTHGYDVTNHNEINPEAGGADAHARFTDALRDAGLGHIVDFVPNHMGIGTSSNVWWIDLLENGPGSQAAPFFDVDWAPAKTELHAKLLLPILGDQYGKVLERGELQMVYRDGSLVLRYFDQELPLNPRHTPLVYGTAVGPIAERLGKGTPEVLELLSILASLENMPDYTEQDPERVAARVREKEVARGRLARLTAKSDVIREEIDAAVARANGEPGVAATFDVLHDLLERQPYRLAYWRTAADEINYRRFFDINTLAGLRVEHSEVFEATHQLLSRLIREERVIGVRIDHPDGLFKPASYFADLQNLAAKVWQLPPRDDGGRPEPPLYVVAEKILSGNEPLPLQWEVHGTTGYNYLNDLNGIFVDASHARRMRRVYARLTGCDEPFEDVVYAAKRLIMNTAMSSELSVLAHMLDRIGESNRRSRDFTMESLRDAITEVVACFPVYRTYVDEEGWTAADRASVERAIARARRRNPAMEASMFDFFREVMLPRDVDAEPLPDDRRAGYPPQSQEEARERRRFAMKLQQYTGPVQAKGLEDTAFYRYNLLLSLNEVGGDPSRFGVPLDAFHQANARRLRDWPFEMTTTATHDTKLGEDVRARLNALSELPEEWGRAVSAWMRLNRPNRTLLDGEPAPDRNDEYRFYQVVVGAWPADLPDAATEAPAELVSRLEAYMLKAVREAKTHTSWITPHQDYENSVGRFVHRSLTGAGGARFLQAMLAVQRRIRQLGLLNSLAQVTMKLGSPGIPDFYQGTELWDLNLVDPDNRRPVDFNIREAALADVDHILALDRSSRAAAIEQLLANWQDGRIKLLLTAAGLRLRREMPDVFLSGSYLPLETDLTVKAGVSAFARLHGSDAALFAAPRLAASITGPERPLPLGGEPWKTSRILLPPELRSRTFTNVVTGAELHPATTDTEAWLFVGELFEDAPFAILRSR
jgi:(1->4)-alpha-D-glucan 1-alpha-D-glucosylmutase